MNDSRRSPLADIDDDIEPDTGVDAAAELAAAPDAGTDTDAAAFGDDAPAFTLFAAFRVSSSHPIVIDGRDVPTAVQELDDITEVIESEGITLRGWYDLSGIRSDADLMAWLHGTSVEDLQWALRELRRTILLEPLIRTWSAVGVHRDGDPVSDRAPGFVRGEEPRSWVTVASYARCAEWFGGDAATRERALAAVRRAGSAPTAVTPHIVTAAGLGDADWLAAFEADELTELVDLARGLRGDEALGAVSAIAPTFTGRLIETVEIVEVLQ